MSGPHRFRSEVIAHLVEKTGVAASDVLSRSHDPRATRARQAVYAGLRDRGWTFHQIGIAMGRDHSTVIHGDRAHRRRQQGDMA